MAGRIAALYAMAAAMAAAVIVAVRGDVPWRHPRPWLALADGLALFASAGLGFALGGVLVAWTRFSVARLGWARQLHVELRPIAHGLGLGHIVVLAGFSSLGEELLFRGLLQPWLGLAPTALLFGLAHQLPGPSRWTWATLALVVGFLFGALFELTGSLVGPLVAHAVVNAANLAYLRDHDPAPIERA
jgi:membrane protease YdiL (CAAX protease family)